MAIINGYENGLSTNRENGRHVFRAPNLLNLSIPSHVGTQEHHTMNASRQKLAQPPTKKSKSVSHGRVSTKVATRISFT